MKRSIWTRDLLDNPFGLALRGYVFPFLCTVWGIVDIVTQQATYKRFTYTGADAVCIGIGVISIGALCALGYNPWCLRLSPQTQRGAFVGFGLTLIVTFGLALLHNI